MKKLLLLFVFVVLASSGDAAPEKVVFVVKRPLPLKQSLTLKLGWTYLVKTNSAFSSQGAKVEDMNFGKVVSSEIVDADGDKKPDLLVIHFQFASEEPLYTYSIIPSGAQQVISKKIEEGIDDDMEIIQLQLSNKYESRNGSIKNWPDKIIDGTMKFYPDPSTISIHAPGKWSYEYGFFLNAMFEQWQKTRKKEYFDYMKEWADHFVDARGMMTEEQYDVSEYKLDDILPGRLLISLYTVTKEEKYRIAAERFEDQLQHQPKTSDGGYWHKQIYPNQMWLDGIFMADVFSVQFANVFARPKGYDEAIQQIKLIAAHTTDPRTGLMYHGWDESKNKIWANPEKGTSPEFWSRAIGWYIMALVQSLDYIPENHPQRKEVIALLQRLAKNVARYQDKRSGLWFQVMDKGDKAGNWIETSGSAMFAYAFAKGVRQGHLDKSYGALAKRAFGSLINNYVYFDDQGRLYFDQTVKVGTLNFKTSNGDFDYYCSGERRINDYKGLAALLYASLEIK